MKKKHFVVQFCKFFGFLRTVPTTLCRMALCAVALGGCVDPLEEETAAQLPNPSGWDGIPQAAEQEKTKASAPFSSLLRQTRIVHDQPPPLCLQQKISLSLSGTFPAVEVFWQLSRQAQVNVALDPSVKGTVQLSYHGAEVPLEEVLDSLCHMSGLRYYFSGKTLHICADTAHLRAYNIQFFLGVRKTHTHTSIKTNLLTENVQNASDTSLKDGGAVIMLDSSNTVDFWQEMEKNITLILQNNAPAGQEGATPPVAEGAQHPDGTDRRPTGAASPSSYSLNRYSGVLSVYGNSTQHRAIATYLSHLQKLLTTQVLIEAKIIEVDLMDEYKSGINWSIFGAQFAPETPPTPEAGGLIPSGVKLDNAQGMFSFHMQAQYLSLLVDFMEKFGTVKTLANPRLTVLNNQSAVLKVARNEVFFEMTAEEVELSPGKKKRQYVQRGTSRVRTIPIGLLLYVHPAVNFETGEIILSLHPTISRVVGYRSDPTVSIQSQQKVSSEVPIVQIREMDSVIVARENQIIVTGGLMEEQSREHRTGLPFISEIPVLGELFAQKSSQRYLTELVILLKLSIVPTAGAPLGGIPASPGVP